MVSCLVMSNQSIDYICHYLPDYFTNMIENSVENEIMVRLEAEDFFNSYIIFKKQIKKDFLEMGKYNLNIYLKQ
jgi:hypothetical protein